MAKPPPPSNKTSVPSPVAVVDNLKQPQAGDLKPLNFKVDPAFHREFKTYAATHGISMLELLREGFDLVKQNRGKI
ncbi:hypothetical protein [Chromatium okenii]|uniref:hypothetical protein n=1 Tax=Chromatium okenii TaxID=61644 RepID=UPI0018D4F5BE|nr:hypothetical protein [Chromatium okenii]MBV5309589.1 hypothetical protein [Chromatium okenii]